MQPVANPPNPYLSEHREWLGPPPAARLEVYEEHAASILATNDSPDIPYRWSVNPYRGCQHACAYCYARRTHEYFGLGAGTDFDTRIIVKVNAAQRLAVELARPAWQREAVIFSGVTDCYQPLEAVYGLTRACLEVCLRFNTPVSVTTKSYLVVRDADVLADLRRQVGAHVAFSIPFADREMARRIEPHAPPPARQFEAMRRLADAGVPVGVMVAPVIPGLNDRDIPRVLKAAAAAGATTAGFTPVRLPGNVRDVFLGRLRAELPDAARRVEQRILDLRDGKWNDPRFGHRLAAGGIYWESVERLFETVATRCGLDAGQSWRQCACGAPAAATPRQLSLFETSPKPC